MDKSDSSEYTYGDNYGPEASSSDGDGFGDDSTVLGLDLGGDGPAIYTPIINITFEIPRQCIAGFLMSRLK